MAWLRAAGFDARNQATTQSSKNQGSVGEMRCVVFVLQHSETPMLQNRFLHLLPGGALNPGDVFRMRFPYGADRTPDGTFEIPPNPRICLMLSRGRIGADPMNVIAPGLRAEGQRLRPDDILIDDPAEIAALKLDQEMIFRASHRLMICPASELFDSGAILGRLSTAQRAQFDAVIQRHGHRSPNQFRRDAMDKIPAAA